MYDPATGELLEEAMADEVYEEDEDDDPNEKHCRKCGRCEIGGWGHTVWWCMLCGVQENTSQPVFIHTGLK